jgi:UDP-glucuronate 4-epimerase
VRRSGRESGDVLHTGADISRARDELGYEPATGVREGLRQEVRWTADRGDARTGLAAAG